MDKREQDVIDSLSEWGKPVRSFNLETYESLKSRSMSVNATSVFKDLDVAKILSTIHDKYVVVPADIVRNYIVFVCKTYYNQCLIYQN